MKNALRLTETCSSCPVTWSPTSWAPRKRRSRNDPHHDRYAVLEMVSSSVPWCSSYERAPHEMTEATIRPLVDAFYARVRRDPTLGPIFADAIAEDAWPVHLEKMYAFWSSVMLTSGRYKGDPVSTIARSPGLNRRCSATGSTCSRQPPPSCSSPTSPTFAQSSPSHRRKPQARAVLPSRSNWPEDLRRRPSVSAHAPDHVQRLHAAHADLPGVAAEWLCTIDEIAEAYGISATT